MEEKCKQIESFENYENNSIHLDEFHEKLDQQSKEFNMKIKNHQTILEQNNEIKCLKLEKSELVLKEIELNKYQSNLKLMINNLEVQIDDKNSMRIFKAF